MKTEKKPKSPFGALVHTSPEPEIASDGHLSTVRVNMKVDNLKGKIPAPAHTTPEAHVCTAGKGARSYK